MVIIPGATPSALAALAALAAAAPRRRVRQGSGGFDVPEGNDVPAPAAAAPAAGLSGLLAMQEAAAAETGDLAAQHHAETVMQELGSLQLKLLRGQAAGAASRLASLTRATPRALDPGLAGVLRAVRLRAEVEAARNALARQPAHPAAGG